MAEPSAWAKVEAEQIVSREAVIRGAPCLTLAADIARVLDEAELRGHKRACEETAIHSIHKAVAAERAAIVAYLRTAAAGCGAYSGASFEIAAGVIERGEHRPAEKP